MIVVAIVSILAAVAIPNFYQFTIKSKRSEAYIGLGGLFNAEVSFKASENYFTMILTQLDFSMNGPPTASNYYCKPGVGITCGKFFYFFVPIASSNTFVGQAFGRPDPQAGDDTFVVYFP